VRTAFIAAMAAAAGVQPNQVTIHEVITNSRRRRRLLSIDASSGDFVDVHASVTGGVALRDLDQHMNRHKPNLHVRHQWQHAQQVSAVPMNIEVQIEPVKSTSIKSALKERPESHLERKARTAAKLMNAQAFMESMYKG
jgi:hypothetical protein